MHETGIAQNILDISIKIAKKHSSSKINLISVRIGKVSAVEESSLRFAFDVLKAETIAKDAHLEVESIQLKGICVDCGKESEYEGYFMSCPHCSSKKISMLSGNELEIAHIDVD